MCMTVGFAMCTKSKLTTVGFYNLTEAQVHMYLLKKKKKEQIAIFKLVKYSKITKRLLTWKL